MAAYMPGELSIIHYGRGSTFRVVDLEQLREVASARTWSDAVLSGLERIAPDLADFVRRQMGLSEALSRRWVSAAHIFLRGYVWEVEPGYEFHVESETQEGAFYRVVYTSGSSRLFCTCPDWHYNNIGEDIRWPPVGGHVVCKHTLAVQLWMRYNYDKGGEQDAVSED